MIAALLFIAAVPDAGTPLLVPADATFAWALFRPRDPTLPDAGASTEVQLGYRIFSDTAKYGAPFAVNSVSCKHCHLNAGQKDAALPLVGIAAVYPQPNKRAGRAFTLEDRIIGCLLRSSDGANAPAKLGGARHENAPAPAFISPDSKVVRALAAYVGWLSDGFAPGEKISWRSKNEVATKLPIAKLDAKKGEELFTAKQCVVCHAADGQGAPLGVLTPGPLWGPRSWNDGAGLARVYTLAGYLRFAMPYLTPGSLTDEEAQHLALYICSKPRPVFSEKARDYQVEPLPPDAVYYQQPR